MINQIDLETIEPVVGAPTLLASRTGSNLQDMIITYRNRNDKKLYAQLRETYAYTLNFDQFHLVDVETFISGLSKVDRLERLNWSELKYLYGA